MKLSDFQTTPTLFPGEARAREEAGIFGSIVIIIINYCAFCCEELFIKYGCLNSVAAEETCCTKRRNKLLLYVLEDLRTRRQH